MRVALNVKTNLTFLKNAIAHDMMWLIGEK